MEKRPFFPGGYGWFVEILPGRLWPSDMRQGGKSGK